MFSKSRCHTKRRMGVRDPFGMTTTKTLRSVFSWHTLNQEYKKRIEKEIHNICHEVIKVLDKYLIRRASTPESKIFFYKMKGDYYRWVISSNMACYIIIHAKVTKKRKKKSKKKKKKKKRILLYNQKRHSMCLSDLTSGLTSWWFTLHKL